MFIYFVIRAKKIPQINGGFISTELSDNCKLDSDYVFYDYGMISTNNVASVRCYTQLYVVVLFLGFLRQDMRSMS